MSDLLELYGRLKETWGIFAFRPTPKQDTAFRSHAGIIMLSGGWQAGKTTWGCAKDWSAMIGFHPWMSPDDPDFLVRRVDGKPITVPNIGRVTCTDFPSGLMQAVLPKFLEMAPKGFYDLEKNAQGYPTHLITRWGSETWFMSHDQEPMKFHSGTGHWVHHDEAPPRPVRLACMRGLMRHSGPEWFTMTPVVEPYLFPDVFDRADGRKVDVFRIETQDNLKSRGGVLDDAVFENLKAVLSPAEREIMLMGSRGSSRGRCLPHFDSREPWVVEDFPVPRDWYRVSVIDPHERRPAAILWWACDPKGSRSVIYDEVMDERSRGSVERTAATIRALETMSGGPPHRRLMDPRAARKFLVATERTYQDEFARYGIQAEAAPGIGIDKGMNLVNGWFSLQANERPFLQVMRHCEQTINQCHFLSWPSRGADISQTRRPTYPDDMVACLRYLATWGPNVDRLRQSAGREFIRESPDEDQVADYALDGTHCGY